MGELNYDSLPVYEESEPQYDYSSLPTYEEEKKEGLLTTAGKVAGKVLRAGLPTKEEVTQISKEISIPEIESERVQDLIELGADIGLGTSGSIYGGAIGTAILPGPGTFIGSVIGGMIGASGASVVTDYTDSIINGADLNADDIALNMSKEAKQSLIFDIGTEVLLSPLRNVKAVAKGAVKAIPETTIKKMANKARIVRRLDGLTKRLHKINDIVFDTETGLKQINKEYKKTIDAANIKKEQIAKAVESTKEQVAIKTMDFQSSIDNIGKQRAVLVQDMVKPFNKALSKSNAQLKSMYGDINQVFGENPLNLIEEVKQVDDIIQQVGLDAFDSASLAKLDKVRGLAEKIAGGRKTNVSDAIDLKQDLYDISASIFTKKGGSAAKSGIGQDVKGLISGLDARIDKATGGASTKVNKAYNGYKTLENINSSIIKDFDGELGGQIGERLSEKQLSRAFTGYFDKLSKVDDKALELINSGKMSVHDYSNSTIDKLYELPNALIYTGDNELIEVGNDMFRQLNELSDLAMSKSQLSTALEDLTKMETEYIKNIKGKVPNVAEIKRNFDQMKEPLGDSLDKARLQYRNVAHKVNDIRKQLGVSEEILTSQAAGATAANVALAAGQPGLSGGLRAIGWINSLKKFNPVMNKMGLDYIRKMKSLNLASKISNDKKRFISKTLDYFYEQYQESSTESITE